MDRREFTKLFGIGVAAIPFSSFMGLPIDIQNKIRSEEFSRGDEIIVLLQLGGGNDGLSTVIPMSQYDTLKLHRPNLMFPENKLLKLDGSDLRVPPYLTGIRDLFNDGMIGIVQNVGVFNGTRSHFTSTNMVQTCIAGRRHPKKMTGFVGRALAQEHPNFPQMYPTDRYPHPFAISMNAGTSYTCESSVGNFSFPAKATAKSIHTVSGGMMPDSDDNSYYANHMRYIADLDRQRSEYGKAINEAIKKGVTKSQKYGNSQLSNSLRGIVKLKTGGLRTNIFVLSLGGFDTHGDQFIGRDLMNGKHPALMRDFNTSISAFMHDLGQVKDENGVLYRDRVTIVTYSEFGRQIKENGSRGTDHGDAGPMFVISGKCFKNQVVGDDPVIKKDMWGFAGVEVKIDYKDYFATILSEKFSSDNIQESFPENEVKKLPIFCEKTVTDDSDGEDEDTKKSKLEVVLYPNPVRDKFTIAVGDEEIMNYDDIRVYNTQGSIVVKGTNNVGHLASGIYFVSFEQGEVIERIKIIKT